MAGARPAPVSTFSACRSENPAIAGTTVSVTNEASALVFAPAQSGSQTLTVWVPGAPEAVMTTPGSPEPQPPSDVATDDPSHSTSHGVTTSPKSEVTVT
jgi:hypothetical protein